MTKKLFLPVCMLSLFLLSCGGAETDPETIADKVVEEMQSSGSTLVVSSPCELLSVNDVRTICSVSNDYEIEQEDKKYTYPTCSFRWEDGKVKKEMEVAGRKMTIDHPSEVLVVMVVEANEAMYDRSTKVYEDGEDISSVGEKAIWGTDMSQLSFLESGYLFHVHVQTSNDNEENKKQAIEIAQTLMSNI